MYYVEDGLRRPESMVFRTKRNRRVLQFRLPEVRRLLGRSMTKKERGNGLATHLSHVLDATGICSYELWNSQTKTRCGITCQRNIDAPHAYRVFLWGIGKDNILARMNEAWERALMLQTSCVLHEVRRRLGGQFTECLPKCRPRTPSLKQHFRHSRLTWHDAVIVVGRAVRREAAWIHRRMCRAINANGSALIRIKTFVIRIDIVDKFSSLVSTDMQVELWTTDDNTHAIYRRMRNRLRQSLKRERKEKVRAREQVREWRERLRRMRALAARG